MLSKDLEKLVVNYKCINAMCEISFAWKTVTITSFWSEKYAQRSSEKLPKIHRKYIHTWVQTCYGIAIDTPWNNVNNCFYNFYYQLITHYRSMFSSYTNQLIGNVGHKRVNTFVVPGATMISARNVNFS